MKSTSWRAAARRSGILVDYWVVCDTGSTDGTPAAVLSAMAGVPGELHRTEWQDFGQSRTEAICLARDKADYILVLDADMVANVKGDFKQMLRADAYEIRYEGPIDYTQRMLLSNGHDWRFVGPTHEYVYAPTERTRELLPQLTLTHFGDGGMRTDKFERDVRLLTTAVANEPDNPRYKFYLAQSYRDVGQPGNALEWYRRRVADETGWDEERWHAMYQVGRMEQSLGEPWANVLESFLRAYQERPWRVEPIYEIVKHYRLEGQFLLGALFAAPFLPEPSYPDDRLFIDREAYLYNFPLESGVCLVGAGRAAEAVAIFNQLLDRAGTADWVADAAIRGRQVGLDMLKPRREPLMGKANHLRVVVPFHNPGHYLDNCIESLLSQDYDNFAMVFVDDASTDESAGRVPVDDPRVTLRRNERRVGEALCAHLAILECCDADDIVAYLYGRDWLSCRDALSYVNRFYNEHDCSVMYGQFQFASGAYGCSKPFPEREAFDRLPGWWPISHLCTFRAGLYQRASEDGGPGGTSTSSPRTWPSSPLDPALLQPVLELAGFERVFYSERVVLIRAMTLPKPRPSEEPLSWLAHRPLSAASSSAAIDWSG